MASGESFSSGGCNHCGTGTTTGAWPYCPSFVRIRGRRRSFGMAATEANPQRNSERLTAIEAVLPHLATKADIADLRVDMERVQSSLIKWFIGTWLATIAILAPLLIYILSRLTCAYRFYGATMQRSSRGCSSMPTTVSCRPGARRIRGGVPLRSRQGWRPASRFGRADHVPAPGVKAAGVEVDDAWSTTTWPAVFATAAEPLQSCQTSSFCKSSIRRGKAMASGEASAAPAASPRRTRPRSAPSQGSCASLRAGRMCRRRGRNRC